MTSSGLLVEVGAASLSNGDEMSRRGPEQRRAREAEPSATRTHTNYHASYSKHTNLSEPPLERRHSKSRSSSLLRLLVLAGAALTLAVAASDAASQPANATVSQADSSSLAGSQARRATKSGADSKTKASGFEQQQSSDLSSMYVQIPIAEPVESNSATSSGPNPDQTQQAIEEGDSQSDSNKASTWTGPFPKKFQIGYIKQSDLHQVLMESLKNDPFLGSKKGSASKAASSPAAGSTTARPSTLGATKSGAGQQSAAGEPVQQQVAPPSDASSLMQSTPFAKSAAVQQVAAKLKHHQQKQPMGSQMGSMQFQQPPRHQAQQQLQWPAGNSHGRLTPQMVQPRPHAGLDYLGKGNLFQAGSLMMMQPHNLNQHNHMQHHLHQQQQQHRALPQAANNFRNNAGRHQARPALHQHMLAQQQAFKYGQAPLVQQTLAFDQQPVQFGGANAQSFTNQPIYTVNSNNFNQQQAGPVGDQMELIQLTNNPAANRQKSKSEYVMSSWRPVQTTSSGEEIKQQQMNEFPQTDSFDEEFGAPATGSSASMNRHPVLNNFLQGSSNYPADSESDSKTLSFKRARQQAMEKAAGGANGVKGRGFDADSVQQRQEVPDGSTKSETSRRAAAANNNNSTAAPGGSDATGGNATATATTTSTMAPTDGLGSKTAARDEGEQAASSTSSPLTSTTTTASGSTASPMANQTTTASSSMETTTEPDSEVFETDSTEASTDEETTTMATATTTTAASGEMSASSGRASSTSQPTLPSPSSSTAASVEGKTTDAAGGGDSIEVSIREQQAGGSLPDSVQRTDERAQTSTSSTSTPMSGQREETTPRPMSELETGGSGATSSTPSSLESSSGASKTDASMSDEALMAAAVRASELTKSSRASVLSQANSSSRRPKAAQAQNQTTSSAGTRKSTRSSDRIVQSSGGSNLAGGVKGGNKLITRRPSAGQRAGKQISAGVKGANQTSTSGKDAKSRAKAKTTEKLRERASSTQKATKGKAAAKTSAKLAGSAALTTPKTSAKITRMAPQLVSAQQQVAAVGQTMVSMTAAQAQSAAQTLASLLLSRCLSSSNCAHLLDVCSTKQAAVPFGATNETSAATTATTAANTTLETTSPASNSNWSMPVGLMSSNLMGLMQALQADRALQLFPAWREAIETIMDQEAPAGYTLIMPANEAVDRMPSSQVDALLASSEQMSQLIENHIVDSAVTIELAPARQTQVSAASQRQRHQTRYVRSKGLQINQHRDRMVTINGKRVVYANQPASGGRIHVIDGLLDWPGQALDSTGSNNINNNNNRLLDIMDTLKQCDKFDGFVTLAEGTGLTQILKQDEPLTVFVPSNEALRKIPDEELEVIKTNSTALREFIMYHIVNGSYFSQDLRDGQQLASILDRRPIQVGVRVDGCSRRLVEANTSPMRRADIAAKNGVIHILDWYLTTRDNEWCDPIGRPALQANSGASNQQDSPATSSERLQQVASEQVVAQSQTGGYATRMSSLPANHKPAAVVAPPIGNEMDQASSSVQTSATRLTGDQQQHVPSVVIESVQ